MAAKKKNKAEVKTDTKPVMTNAVTEARKRKQQMFKK